MARVRAHIYKYITLIHLERERERERDGDPFVSVNVLITCRQNLMASAASSNTIEYESDDGVGGAG